METPYAYGLRCGDDTFGPAVSSTQCRSGFDFTLFFEESILAIPLAVLLLLCFPIRLTQLLRKGRVTGKGRLYNLKILSTILLATLQLATLVIWIHMPVIKTRISIAAASLSFVVAGAVGVLTHAEHLHSVSPSTILAGYYILSLVCDIARARTLWLSDGGYVIASVFTCSIAVRALLLMLELLDKSRVLLPPKKSVTPEELSGLLKRSLFLWLNPLLGRGFSNILRLEDLIPISHDLRGRSLEHLVPLVWVHVQDKAKPNMLLMSTILGLRWPIMYAILPRLCFLATTLAQPFLLTKAVQFVEGPTTSSTMNFGYGLIGAYALVYIGMAISSALYWHLTNRVMVMVRGSLIDMIYAKTMNIRTGNLDEAAALTLMSTDVENVVLGFEDMHELWANLAQAIIATWLLERQISWACVAPIIISIGCFLAAASFADKLRLSQRRWNEAIQTRLAVTSRMLGQMKEVKLMGMTDRMLSTVQNLRENEIQVSKRMRRLRIWVLSLSQTTVVLGPVAAFALYVLAAKTSHKESLLTGQAFTALSLIALLASPITILTQAVPSIASGIGCLNRIQEFLAERTDSKLGSFQENDLETRESIEYPSQFSAPLFQAAGSTIGMNKLIAQESVIEIRNASFGWKSGATPTLRNINLTPKPASLTIITGPVGCGKTTLLRGLLGELTEVQGTVRLNAGAVAYCDQIPWLGNRSVRNSIIGFSEFERKWYDTVIQACALEQDFEQLPNGDHSSVGSRGIALSRGQKQRVAIARAIYSRHKVAIFDDVFSGLDTASEEHVFRNVFGPQGLLRKLCTTSLLVTHASHLLVYADHIVVIDKNGEISEQGSFLELCQLEGYVSQLDNSREQSPYEVREATINHRQNTTPQNIETAVAAVDLKRKTGDWGIYSFFLGAAGWSNTTSFLVSSLIVAFLFNFPTLWLKWWSESNQRNPNYRLGMYLGVYFLLAICAATGVAFACWQMIMRMVSRSGMELHKLVLRTVMSAPLAFFVSTDTGITTNRFSQDMQLIDMVLPMATVNTVFFGASCLVQVVIISISANYMAILIPVCGVVVMFIQKFYLRTSRQLRLLDLEAKSPLYSNFIESLSGLVTIRAFKWQEPFKAHNLELLDKSQVPNYLLFCIQRWLNLVLDLVVAAIAVVLVILAVKLRGQISGGSIGVALVNVTTFNVAIVALIRFWTAMETSLGAVARVKQFAFETASEIRACSQNPPQDWPCRGAINFDGVTAFHTAGAAAVLKNVSFSIHPGQKVGVCGRTGSGKSSLILSLFQMLDPAEGSISIDGIDLSTLPRETVRSRLNCITQDPLFIPGTVRLNADLTGSVADATIIAALEKVCLWDLIRLKGGLDVEMMPDELSLGQQQLFCLARAMLRKSSILVLDEISSSVDQTTDDLMHQIIKEHFVNTTVIEVAHRLDSILDFDRVLLLDHGEVLEYNDPRTLLSQDTLFARFYHSKISGE